MIGKWGLFIAAALCAATGREVWAQVPQFATLEIEWENGVTYHDIVTDPARRATSPNIVNAVSRTFTRIISIADIASVNGKPARGSVVLNQFRLQMSSNPVPGQSIGEGTKGAMGDQFLDIVHPDGTAIGTIMGAGFILATPPPGTPPAQSNQTHNIAVTGGTGAYLGVRGMLTGLVLTGVGFRVASMEEDPANRRLHGGERGRFVAYLIPLIRPEVTSTDGRPAVFHASDFSPVSESKPAAPGEVLSIFATGLGPTSPGQELGKPFPGQPLHQANSPIEVLVNGKAAAVLGAVGYPGSVDTFQVNFRMPEDTAGGPATLQLSAAWITGPGVKVAVQ